MKVALYKKSGKRPRIVGGDIQELHGELEDESVLEDGVEYGVVFIEMY